MELEFDKEIDALLRKTTVASPVSTAAPASAHLNADELTAFAENALPDGTRQLYVAHLADCDTCRKTLAGFISIAPEAASEAAFAADAIPVAAIKIPWHRRLLAMPNLAYVLGTLVVIFSGFIGYQVLQNRLGRNAEVSKITEQQPVSNSPIVAERPEEYSNAATANSNMTTNANSSSPIESVTKSGVEVGSASSPSATEEDRVAAGNEVARNEPSITTAAPQPPPKEAPAVSTERDTKIETEKQAKPAEKDKEETIVVTDENTMRRADDQRAMRELQPGAKSAPSRIAGPRQQMTNQNNANLGQNQVNGVSLSARSVTSLPSSSRTAGGKTFELRGGIWYDTAYRGGGTKGVKRGTEKFLKLDEGLRNIADTVGGTVVVVWNGKAYKFQ